tara:strand:- start:1396 stop:2094 length:699 start_codon:yes stop_codon:yes gene_type:complete
MKLDLMKPLFVIPGRWNSSIFSPEWLAKHFYNFEGDSIEGNIIEVYDSGALTKSIIFVNGIGVAASDVRVEVFASDIEVDHLEEVKSATVRLLSCLEHTPIGAFGLNLRFIELEDSQPFQEQLEIVDSLMPEFPRTNIKISTTYQYNDDLELNIRKNEAEKSLSFNFHNRLAPNSRPADQLERFAIKEIFQFAVNSGKQHFGIEEYEVMAFDASSTKANNDDKTETETAEAI